MFLKPLRFGNNRNDLFDTKWKGQVHDICQKHDSESRKLVKECCVLPVKPDLFSTKKPDNGKIHFMAQIHQRLGLFCAI